MQAELPAVLVAEGNLIGLINTLQTCRHKKDLHHAKRLHAYMRQRRLDSHPVLGNHLVPLLVECQSLPDAQRVFDALPHRAEHAWTSLLSGYVNCRELQRAFQLYNQMQQTSAQPTSYTYVVMLNASAMLEDEEKGHSIHVEIIKHALERQLHIGNALVDMYGKCGALVEACHTFDRLSIRDLVSWNTLIAAYAEHGLGNEVLRCYKHLQMEDLSVDAVTFVLCLKACATLGALETGQEIHAESTKSGLERELYVGNALVDMYGKCGWLVEAHQVFDRMPVHDTISWNAKMAGHSNHGDAGEVLKCFKQMQLVGVPVDGDRFVLCLKACGTMVAIESGREIHAEITKGGLDKDLCVGSTLIDMYGKCGSVVEAHQVLDGLPVRNAVSWTALIAGYADQSLGEEVLKCFNQMQLEGIPAGAATYVVCLKACSTMGALQTGRDLHAQIRTSGMERNLLVGNVLIDMYGKCGSVAEGWDVFDRLPIRDVVSWTAMIKAYSENHDANKAVQCYKEMLEQGVKPDSITFTCLLAACSHASLVLEGEELFKLMKYEYKIEPTSDHYACMVDLFARSGHFNEAGRFLTAMECPPSIESLMNVLSVCKAYGELDLGQRCFQQIVEVNPEDASAYLLMADIYASAARWEDAWNIEKMWKLEGKKKKPGGALIELNKELHKFVVGVEHRGVVDLLEFWSSHMRSGGYVPNLDLAFRHISYEEKGPSFLECTENCHLHLTNNFSNFVTLPV